MKEIFTILFVLILSNVLGQDDEKARSLLQKVSETTQSYKTIAANFEFIMQNEDADIYEVNRGSLKLKGKKYHVLLPDLGIEAWSDGSNISSSAISR